MDLLTSWQVELDGVTVTCYGEERGVSLPPVLGKAASCAYALLLSSAGKAGADSGLILECWQTSQAPDSNIVTRAIVQALVCTALARARATPDSEGRSVRLEMRAVLYVSSATDVKQVETEQGIFAQLYNAEHSTETPPNDTPERLLAFYRMCDADYCNVSGGPGEVVLHYAPATGTLSVFSNKLCPLAERRSFCNVYARYENGRVLGFPDPVAVVVDGITHRRPDVSPASTDTATTAIEVTRCVSPAVRGWVNKAVLPNLTLSTIESEDGSIVFARLYRSTLTSPDLHWLNMASLCFATWSKHAETERLQQLVVHAGHLLSEHLAVHLKDAKAKLDEAYPTIVTKHQMLADARSLCLPDSAPVVVLVSDLFCQVPIQLVYDRRELSACLQATNDAA